MYDVWPPASVPPDGLMALVLSMDIATASRRDLFLLLMGLLAIQEHVVTEDGEGAQLLRARFQAARRAYERCLTVQEVE